MTPGLKIIIALALLTALGIFSYSKFISSPETIDNKQANDHRDSASIQSSINDSAVAKHIKHRNDEAKFQPPLPMPSEYKLNYGDDDDQEDEDVVKQDIISAVQFTENETDDVFNQQAEGVLVGQSPVPSPLEDNFDDDEDDTVLFNNDELEQLSGQGAEVQKNSNLIGGARLSLKDDLADLNNQAKESPTPEPSASAAGRYAGQARGYTLLPLMHPEARPMVVRQLEILEKARLKRAYISLLADGTFELDYPFLEQVVRQLNASGSNLVLGIYFSNGPAMRNETERGRYAGSVNRYGPEEFREKIENDAALINQFKELFRQARSVYILNQSLNPSNANIAYVMLEDNLDDDSYEELRAIAQEELGGVVNFIRNPCPACYEGNTFDPGEDNLELHKPEHLHALRAGDGYSMDGMSLFFPGEFDPTGLSVDDTKTVIQASLSQNLAYFALWRAARQGIYAVDRDHPDERVYEVPSVEQEQYEIDLLRYGLSLEVDEPDEDDDY